METTTIHQNRTVVTTGTPLEDASGALIMLHGRGASAESILGLAGEVEVPDGFALLAPQAARYAWYPYSFLAPLEQNEPWLSSALAAVHDVVQHIEAAGIPADKTVLLGFSQGACLALEYAARHARRYGGVVALSGGLIGSGQRSDATPPKDKTFDYEGALDGTPVLLGCSDVDAHIPVDRVHTSAAVFEQLGAAVTKRIYPGMGHTVNADEVAFVQELLKTVVA